MRGRGLRSAQAVDGTLERVLFVLQLPDPFGHKFNLQLTRFDGLVLSGQPVLYIIELSNKPIVACIGPVVCLSNLFVNAFKELLEPVLGEQSGS